MKRLWLGLIVLTASVQLESLESLYQNSLKKVELTDKQKLDNLREKIKDIGHFLQIEFNVCFSAKTMYAINNPYICILDSAESVPYVLEIYGKIKQFDNQDGHGHCGGSRKNPRIWGLAKELKTAGGDWLINKYFPENK